MGKQYTEAELKKKSVSDLKELAEAYFDEDELEAITTKAPLIEAILNDQSSDEEEEDDEVEEEVEEDDDPELPEEDEVDEAPAPAKTKAKGKQTKYTESGTASNGEKLFGAKEVASQIGTDAKSLRQFFRSGKSSHQAVGAGGRYEFKESDVTAIKAEFEAYKAGKPGRGRGGSSVEGGSKRSRGKRATAEVEVIEEVEEIEELEDLDDELDEGALDIEEEEE